MVKLFREENSMEADAIEAEFREMVLGYDCSVMDSTEARQIFGAGITLPVITNNERVFSGAQITTCIKELRQLMHDWQLFQGDYCYVDDQGKTC
jgi:hypothetical protein